PHSACYFGAWSRILFSVTAPFNPAATICPPSAIRLRWGFLPVTAVEEAGGLETWSVDIVEAARVDGDSVGLGTRHVERVHSAMRGGSMLGHAGAEGIGR